MTSFSSATRALESAIAMQRAFAAHNESAQEPILVQAGMNAGEPIAEDEDLFGTAVIEAARIAAAAKGGSLSSSASAERPNTYARTTGRSSRRGRSGTGSAE